jgi:putative peptidoglycan lipid II flippase
VDALAASIGWVVAASGIIGWTLALSVVPRYISARTTGSGDATAMFRSAAALGAAASLLVAGASFVFADALSVVLLSGSTAGTQHTAATLLRITSPLLVLWTFTILGSSLANARFHFVAPALVTVVPSLFIIGVLLVRPAVEAAAAAYVVGTALQLLALLLFGRRWRGDLLPTFRRTHARRLAPALLPVGISLAALNLALVAARSAASLGRPGDVAALDYAIRLTAALESLLLAGGLQVALTIWSEEAAERDARSRPIRAFVAAALVGSAAAIALIVLAGPVVSILFGGGNFDTGDVALVTLVLIAVAPAVPARMQLFLTHRLLIARGILWRAAAVSAIAVPAVGIGALIGTNALGAVGSGLGFSAGWILVAVVALVAIPRRQPRAVDTVEWTASPEGAVEGSR